MATGSSIQLANASFAANALKASLTCPNRTGLIGEYIFGANSARSVKNIANNGAPLTGTGAGAPVYNANSILLSGSVSYGSGIAGYDTGLVVPADCTLVVVRKKLNAGTLISVAVPWFGNTSPDPIFGFVDYDNWDFYNSQSGTPPAVPKITTPVDTSFHFMCGVGASAQAGVLYAGSGGTLTTATGSVAGASSRAASTIKIVPTGNYQIELAYAAIYNRAISSAEALAHYLQLQAYYAFLGQTVV